MRPVLLQDVLAVARVLAVVPEEGRRALCSLCFEHAETAERYRLREGRDHPRFGSGTLTCAVQDMEADRAKNLHDPVYVDCLRLVLRELSERMGAGSMSQIPSKSGMG